jgi:hypothetical protein
MMMRDRDIYAAAILCIEQHGDAALILAARRADQLGAEHESDRQQVWTRIVEAIKQLQRVRAPDETVN